MKNFISIYDNQLTPDECSAAIHHFETSRYTHQGKLGGQADSKIINTSIKDSTDLTLQFSSKTSLTKMFERHLNKCAEKYKEENIEVAQNIFDWGIADLFNIQRYKPGQAFKAIHCEHSTKETKTVLAWMVYLNTMSDGGGTEFTNYEIITDAIQGRLVIWPAYWTHCHRGILSNTETKYIATGWFSFL